MKCRNTDLMIRLRTWPLRGSPMPLPFAGQPARRGLKALHRRTQSDQLRQAVGVILLAAVPLAFALSCSQKDQPVTGEPSYISIRTCPEKAQLAIDMAGLPKSMIHSCRADGRQIGDNVIQLVQIEYGPADDCPSGCVYPPYAAVLDERENLVPVPPIGPQGTTALTAQLLAQPPFAALSMDLPPQDLIDVALARRESLYGWLFTLKQPFQGYAGSAFYYVDASKRPAWDFSHLRMPSD